MPSSIVRATPQSWREFSKLLDDSHVDVLGQRVVRMHGTSGGNVSRHGRLPRMLLQMLKRSSLHKQTLRLVGQRVDVERAPALPTRALQKSGRLSNPGPSSELPGSGIRAD
jgi:hypothetical protein